MKPMKRFLSLLIPALTLAAAACSSAPKGVEFPQGTDPQAKVDELSNRLHKDRQQQFDVLSPNEYKEASASLGKAQNALAQGKGAGDVLDNAGEAAARMDRMEANASKYGAEFTPVLTARKAALEAHADRFDAKNLQEADSKLMDLCKDSEGGGSKPEVKKISDLQAKYANVELTSIKTGTLGNAQEMIKQAEDRGAKKKAPQTLQEAQVNFDSAQRAVEAYRRDSSSYKPAVEAAAESANKLNQVMTTIETSKIPEAAAVKIYDQQKQIASANESLEQAQAKNEKYASKEEIEKKYQTVRGEFSAEEADVFRDGSKIILRLKKIQFPTARTDLPAASIKTLTKVKDMIAAVPYEKVTVEGHTDNVGGKQKNMELSEQRAEAVQQFLTADNSIPQEKIEAKGFGYEKPLTSNKTAAGRATNRRVDVVIDTSMSSAETQGQPRTESAG